MAFSATESRLAPWQAVDVQDCQNPVIPAQAGIQTRDFYLDVSLDSRLRRSDEKNELAHLVEMKWNDGRETLFWDSSKCGRESSTLVVWRTIESD